MTLAKGSKVADGPLRYESVEQADRACATGRPVLLIDHTGRGELVATADEITTATMASLIRMGSGFVQVALPAAECLRLRLPPMSRHHGEELLAGNQCVAVDAATGVTTGISAADRARTARLLASPATAVDDLVRPGHVIPLRVDGPHSHGAAALELVSHAGSRAAVVTAVVSVADPRRDPSPEELIELAGDYRLPVAFSDELLKTRRSGKHLDRV